MRKSLDSVVGGATVAGSRVLRDPRPTGLNMGLSGASAQTPGSCLCLSGDPGESEGLFHGQDRKGLWWNCGSPKSFYSITLSLTYDNPSGCAAVPGGWLSCFAPLFWVLLCIASLVNSSMVSWRRHLKSLVFSLHCFLSRSRRLWLLLVRHLEPESSIFKYCQLFPFFLKCRIILRKLKWSYL